MGSKVELDIEVMAVNLEEEGQDEEKKLYFVVRDLDNVKVEFSNSEVNDVKLLFDKVFEYIVNEKKLVEFYLEDDSGGLFHEVALDMIDHLNGEIESSESEFSEIILLKEQFEIDDLL